MRKCVFFDRDGVVNRSPGPGWVERWEDFHLLPEFVTALATARGLGYEAVVVTNQRGVAIGCLSREELDRIHDNLREALKREGVDILGVYVCPHDRDEGCECRKPLPGMLLQAARDHDLDLSASWMIGDGERDIEAGRLAGCRTIRVGPRDCGTTADYHCTSMQEVAERLASILGC